MGKETLLKIGQIGCTAVAAFLGICLTQMNIDKAVDKKVKALESAEKKEDEDYFRSFLLFAEYSVTIMRTYCLT